MKIAFFSHSAKYSGGTLAMINVIETLIKNYKHEVIVILPEHGDIEKELKEKHITYKVFKHFNWVYRKYNFKVPLKIILNKFLLKRIEKYIKQENVDIIHINNLLCYMGAVIGTNLDIPYVWHIRDFVEEDHGLRFYSQKLCTKYMNNAKEIIAVSKIVKEKYKTWTSTSIHVIYDGINIENNVLNCHRNHDSKIHALIVGRICEEKGQVEAMKAFHSLGKLGYKNILLHIIGKPTDYYKDIFNNELMKCNEFQNIIFEGYHNDISKYRNQCDIALICSKSEAFGLVTIEAMLSGNIVIAANKGANIELIEHKNTGFIYEYRNIDELTNTLIYIIKNISDLDCIRNNAFHYSLNFSFENNVKKINDLYL